MPRFQVISVLVSALRQNSSSEVVLPIFAVVFSLQLLGCREGTVPESTQSEVNASHRKAEHREITPDSVEQKIVELGKVQNKEVLECSGMAVSRGFDDHLWLHNDSGAKSKIYLVDLKGETRSEMTLVGVKNIDFEDMASFTRDGKHYLLVADVGNNARKRDQLMVYVFPEPELKQIKPSMKLAPCSVLTFQFEDRVNRDCEGVAYGPDGQLLIASKPRIKETLTGKTSELFAVDFDVQIKNQTTVAKKIGELPGGMITAIDCSPDGKKLIAQNYLYANLWMIRDGNLKESISLSQAIRIKLPPQKQSESICFSRDGESLFTTSEGKKQMLYQILLSK